MVATLDILAEPGRLNFDDPTVQETEWHQKMAEKIELREKYLRFLRAVKTSRVNLYNFAEDTFLKVRHLTEIMSYAGVIGREKQIIPFSRVKPLQVGAVYFNIYHTARKACND